MGRAFEYRKARKLKRWGNMSRTFTRIGKEITIAVKAGGPDPSGNSRLRALIANAKAENMPKATWMNAIKKATESDAKDYKEVIYEGFAPNGIAVIVECATDNTTRTVANLRMRAVFTENRQRISGVNSRVEDSLEGARVVKSFAAEDVERAKFRRSNDAYLDSKVRMYRAMGVYQAAIAVMMGFLNVTIVVMGGWLIARGQMEAADLATFALYISLFTNPIDNILNFTETFQKAIAGFARFVEVLNEQPDIQDAPDARELRVTQGAISYSHVEFAYQKGEPVIRDLNLDVRPGETLALVGPSGGGKSTTCSLLPRFYDVEAGSITIDGQDVRKVTQKSLREAIGLVQQDVYLFDGTIAENIAYGRPDATPDQIRLAAQRARVDEFVRELPDGYETQVGERGTRLSGGQKQRIAIARVFLKNPPILIFDEATSALDNESEAAVQESLARLAEGRTTIVIAHRLSTIKDADEIATITDGTVSERGTHEELLAKNGTYAHYYRMQFE